MTCSIWLIQLTGFHQIDLKSEGLNAQPNFHSAIKLSGFRFELPDITFIKVQVAILRHTFRVISIINCNCHGNAHRRRTTGKFENGKLRYQYAKPSAFAGWWMNFVSFIDAVRVKQNARYGLCQNPELIKYSTGPKWLVIYSYCNYMRYVTMQLE